MWNINLALKSKSDHIYTFYNMAESMSDVCKRAVVPPVCFNKDCKCRIEIPSKAAVVGKDNELTEKDMH